MDGSAVKRFCLLLYAPSHLLPSDTADDISRLRSVLEQFLLAVLKRTSTLEMEGPSHWVEMLFRVSRSALEVRPRWLLLTVPCWVYVNLLCRRTRGTGEERPMNRSA